MSQTLTLKVSWDQKNNNLHTTFRIFPFFFFFFCIWATCSQCIHPWIEIFIGHQKLRSTISWSQKSSAVRCKTQWINSPSLFLKGKRPTISKNEKWKNANPQWKKRLLKPMACVLYVHTHTFRLTESPESIIRKGNSRFCNKSLCVQTGVMIVWHHRPQKPQLLKHFWKCLCTKDKNLSFCQKWCHFIINKWLQNIYISACQKD